MKKRILFSIVTPAICLCLLLSPVSARCAEIRLENGEPCETSVSWNGHLCAYIDVPEGAASLTATISNASSELADLDLYLKFGSPLAGDTVEEWDADTDYISCGSTSEESITVTPADDPPLAEGRWYVAPANLEAEYTLFTVTATYEGARTIPLSGSVDLPQAIAPESLELVTSYCEVAPDLSGAFTLDSPRGYPPHLLIAELDNTPLAFTFVRPDMEEASISCTDTAVALLMMRMMLFTLPGEVFADTLDSIASVPEVETLADLICTELETSTDALVNYSEDMAQTLDTTLQAASLQFQVIYGPTNDTLGDLYPRGDPNGEINFQDAQLTLCLSLRPVPQECQPGPTQDDLAAADVPPYKRYYLDVEPWRVLIGDGTDGKPDGELRFTDAQSILARALNIIEYVSE